MLSTSSTHTNQDNPVSDNDQPGSPHSDLNYPPRLASTIASREYAFEADSDTLSLEGDRKALVRHDFDQSDSDLTTGLVSSHEGGHRHGKLSISESISPPMSYEDGQEPLLPFESDRLPDPSSTYNHLLDSGGGLLAGVANMANSILGAGIIGLPYALRNAGFVTGTGLIIILGIITDWSIRLISLNSKLTGQRTYIGILEQCFGFWGKAAVSFFQFTFAFGGMCAFGVIVGELMSRWIS